MTTSHVEPSMAIKPITKQYKKNWDAIFMKKKTRIRPADYDQKDPYIKGYFRNRLERGDIPIHGMIGKPK